LSADEPPEAGPVEAARRWLEHVATRHDIRAAWPGIDPDYRLALAQAVIFLNEGNPVVARSDRDELAHQVSSEDPRHALWPSFADLIIDELLHDLGEWNPEEWQAAAPSPTSPGYELVLFTRAQGGGAGEPAEMHVRGVLMHLRDDRWLVAGLSARPATPGWPPDLGY
jgi:hypothetical protein